MGKGDSLSRRQARFVAALVATPTIEQAARQAGISERTSYRYLQNPAVKAELARTLDNLMGQATRLTVRAMTSALATLQEIHRNYEAPAGSRVAAARAILEAGPRLREAQELAERLTNLENLLTEGDDDE